MQPELDARNIDEFLRKVEVGETRIYHEDLTRDDLRAFIPFCGGGLVAITSLIFYSIMAENLSFVVFFSFTLSPMIIGVLITFYIIIRIGRKRSIFTVRGLSRSLWSAAISFLDMILEGQAKVGKILDQNKPEEYHENETLAFGATLQILQKIDRDLAKLWISTLREKLSPEISLKSKILLITTVYGSIVIMAAYVVLEILRITRLVNIEDLFLIILILVITIIVFVVTLTLYVIKSSRSGVPEGVYAALSEPDVRMESERALKKIVEVFKTESRYPLRVLVIGEHKELIYTNRVYRTSQEFVLKAAVLIPTPSEFDSSF